MHDDGVTDNRARWNKPIQALHWLTVMLLLFQAYIGLYDMPAAVGGNLHATVGLTLLVVMVLRLAARFLSKPPAARKSSMALIARGVHVLLYAGVFALIVSGLLSIDRSPFAPPAMVFGSVPLPAMHWFPARWGSLRTNGSETECWRSFCSMLPGRSVTMLWALGIHLPHADVATQALT